MTKENPAVLTLDAALGEVGTAGGDAGSAGGSASASSCQCAVCFSDFTPGEVVQCLNPRKRHALCKDCFLGWFKSRGKGPFAGLTVAQVSGNCSVCTGPRSKRQWEGPKLLHTICFRCVSALSRVMMMRSWLRDRRRPLQASQPMCVHANKQSRNDECLCSDAAGDYSKSFFSWRCGHNASPAQP